MIQTNIHIYILVTILPFTPKDKEATKICTIIREVNNLLKNRKYENSAKEPDEITKALKKMKTY